MKHTATKRPWSIAGVHVDRGNIQIGSPEDYIGEIYANCPEHRANAEFIVRACNNYEPLLETLKIIKEALILGFKGSEMWKICGKAIKQAEET